MNKYEYNFCVDRVGYTVRFGNDAQLSFFTFHSNFDEWEDFSGHKENYGTFDLSAGASIKVFREVEKIAVRHIKKHKIDYVWFTCVPSRSSLYIRLADHLSKEVGLRISNVNNTEFYLSK